MTFFNPHRAAFVVQGITLAIIFAALPAAAQNYTIREVPLMFGSDVNSASDISDKGVVAGTARNTATNSNRGYYLTPPHTTAVSIGVPTGYDQVFAYGINNTGIVVGEARIGTGITGTPLAAYRGLLVILQPPFTNRGEAREINDAGLITGFSEENGFTFSGAAFAETSPLAQFDLSLCLSVNSSGVKVGYCDNEGISSKRAAQWVNTAPAEIPPLAVGNSYANDIADNGLVVGMSEIQGGEDRAFTWTEEDGTTNLGVLGSDTNSEACGTNGTDVVGFSMTTINTKKAVLFQGGSVINLNNLIAQGLGWELKEARAINTHGQICGNGTLNGEARGFILTPNPPTGAAADWDFKVGGDNGWTAATNIPPFEPAEATHVPGTGYGIRATNFPAFGLLQSPVIPLQVNRRYRIWCTIATTAASADAAPQIRMRAIEAATNYSELLSIDSTGGVMPGPGNSKTYVFALTTPVGNLETNYRLNLDLTFFDPFDQQDAWIYLERVVLQEE